MGEPTTTDFVRITKQSGLVLENLPSGMAPDVAADILSRAALPLCSNNYSDQETHGWGGHGVWFPATVTSKDGRDLFEFPAVPIDRGISGHVLRFLPAGLELLTAANCDDFPEEK